MKQLLLKMFVFCLLSFTTLSINNALSQETDIQKILMSKIWVEQYEGDKEETLKLLMSFTVDSVRYCTEGYKKLYNSEIEAVLPYYLNNEITAQFQSDKVGKYKTGKYIVQYGGPKPRIFKIISISENKLILETDGHKGLYTLTYKPIE